MDLLAWLGERYSFVSETNQNPGFAGLGAQLLDVAYIQHVWERADLSKIGRLGRLLSSYLPPVERAGILGQAQRRANLSEPSSHLLHRFEDDADLMKRASDLTYRHFRRELTLDWLSGNICLRVGKPSLDAPPVDSVTAEYRKAIAQLPLLSEQGDGIKSFLGILMPLLSAVQPIVIVDEPEAFLHPPQAVSVGREIGSLSVKNGLQVILATHDRNILIGLLESGVDLSVIRLDREGDLTTAHQIDAQELRNIWSDTVLRYSNLLDGLFHRVVVLAEGDRDCRFYAATLEEWSKQNYLPFSPSEVLFVPSAGKDGMPKMASVLRAAQVKVICSPDLDILDDENKLRILVSSLDGAESWDSLSKDYRLATEDFRKPRQQVRCGYALNAVSSVIKGREDELYTGEIKKEILANLRAEESPWKKVKRYGERSFVGQARVAFERLMPQLESLGIAAVRMGELECFAEDTGVSKGEQWLPAAFSAGAHKRAEAQKHVASILRAAGISS
nr:AAA family ATPase [Actinomadura bangladeshensis]